MDKKITILGIPGSLRKSSYNRAALNAAREFVSDIATIQLFENLAAIPPFNQDHEKDPPPAVVALKNDIRGADAILFATPEYNYSIPGVLKNAIDWASRPYGDSAWEGKPVAVMSASTSMIGGARAQYHLRQTFVFLNMFPLNRPEVIIPEVTNKINSKGEIVDAHTNEKIKELVEALVEWSIKLRSKTRKPSEKEKYEYESSYSTMRPQ